MTIHEETQAQRFPRVYMFAWTSPTALITILYHLDHKPPSLAVVEAQEHSTPKFVDRVISHDCPATEAWLADNHVTWCAGKAAVNSHALAHSSEKEQEDLKLKQKKKWKQLEPHSHPLSLWLQTHPRSTHHTRWPPPLPPLSNHSCPSFSLS